MFLLYIPVLRVPSWEKFQHSPSLLSGFVAKSIERRIKIDVAHNRPWYSGSIDFATKPENSDRLFWNFSHDCTLKSCLLVGLSFNFFIM